MISRIFGTIFGILLLLSPHLFAGEVDPKKAPPSEEVAVRGPGMDDSIENAQKEVEDPFAQRFNPFEIKAPTPQGTAEGQAVGDLQGIGLGGKDGYAVIGDTVYHVGEEKNGIKLLEVNRGEVDIFVNNGKMTLPLFPGDDLKKARERKGKKSSRNFSSNDSSKEEQEPFSKRGQGLS